MDSINVLFRIQLMQQFMHLDKNLNYVPYRFRNRSNPHHKNLQQQLNSRSQSKRPKFNPQHILIAKNRRDRQKTTIKHQDKQDDDEDITPHRKNGLKVNQFQSIEAIISSLFSPENQSPDLDHKAVQKEYTQYRFKNDLSFDGTEEREQAQQQKQQWVEEDIEQAFKQLIPNKKSLFNQSEVQQMKQEIIQNIEQSNKGELQNQQTNYQRKQETNEPNTHIDNKYSKGNNRQSLKDKIRSKQALSKKNNSARNNQTRQQQIQLHRSPSELEDNKKVTDDNIQVEQYHQQIFETNKKQPVKRALFSQHIRINNFHTETISPSKPQTNQITNALKANKSPKPILKNIQPDRSQVKIEQASKEQKMDLLSYFTKEAPNKAIQLLKQQRSKQKQKNASQPSPSYSSYRKANMIKPNTKDQSQSYSFNMKKNKQKVPIIQINKIKQKLSNQKDFIQIKQRPIEQQQSSHRNLINIEQQPPQQSSQVNEGEMLSSPTSRIQQRQSHQGQSSNFLKSQEQDSLLKIIDTQALRQMVQNPNSHVSSLFIDQQFPAQNNNTLIQNEGQQIGSSKLQESNMPSVQNFSISSSSLYYQSNYKQQASFNLKEQLEKDQDQQDVELLFENKAQSLIQINEDSMVFQTQQFNRYQSQNLMNINLRLLEKRPQQDPFNPYSRRTNQAQIDQNSIREYRSHFHPKNEAMRKFKHAKQSSSVDVQQKVLKSSRMNHHSLSTLKRNKFAFEGIQRRKTRKEKNTSRFKTRMTEA